MLPPWPLVGQVLSQDPEHDSITVIIQSGGQYATAPIRILYHGHADAMRLNKKPLPGKGTWGLVVFPNGDIRNGSWLGGYHSTLMDAIPADASDPFMSYDAHYSGDWHLLDQYGNRAQQFADGSTLTINASGAALPTVYRHTVDENQQQQRVIYPFKDRVPNPPPPFATSYGQAVSGSLGGATVTIDASGNTSFTCATTGHTFTITYNSATIQVSGNGNISITDANNNSIAMNTNGIQITDKYGNKISMQNNGININTISQIGLQKGSDPLFSITTSGGNSNVAVASIS